jgi:hypothetical protein
MGKKLDVNTEKRLRPQKRLLGNKSIVVIKIATAALLFFACCLFFFQYMDLFWSDLKNWIPFPIVFFAGLIWVCIYIGNLVAHIESRNLYLSDRYDWLYKIVFTVIILSMVVRSFFAKPYLQVPEMIIVLCIISGIITYLTPKIVDNSNDDF